MYSFTFGQSDEDCIFIGTQCLGIQNDEYHKKLWNVILFNKRELNKLFKCKTLAVGDVGCKK